MTQEQELIHWRNMVKLYKFDHLTGLKQRRDFEVETLHKMANQEFHLAMFDVDGLHSLNREKGYEAGDALIRKVVMDIQTIPGAWELYRIGGDEFIGLFFDPPNIAIPDATGACLHSGAFSTLSDLLEAVDQLVTDKKTAAKTRRVDD